MNGYGTLYRTLCAVVAACILSPSPLSRAADKASVAGLESLTAQWVALQMETAGEQRDWNEQRDQLTREIALLEAEADHLADAMSAMRRESAVITDQRVNLIAEQRALRHAATEMVPLLTEAEEALRSMAARVPPALRQALNDGGRLLPGVAADRLSVGQRLQQVAGTLESFGTLTRSIHTVREVLNDTSGQRREMDVIYLGLTRGYAVAPDNRWAAVGRPGPSGWQWSHAPDLAATIRHAIDIAQENHAAELVLLPLGAPETADE